MLRLHSDHIQAIKTQAETTYPDECCGLMLGQTTDEMVSTQAGPAQTVTDQRIAARTAADATGTSAISPSRTVVEVWPVTNTWNQESQAAMAEVRGDAEEASFTTRRRYWIDPKDMLAAQKYARNNGLSIIGIYHSHPDYPAMPSECDRACAWPEYSYIIVSVPKGKATDVFSWVLDGDRQFQPEDLQLKA